MAIKVAINGFGRIGRLLFRAAIERNADIDFMAVNDLADPTSLAHLLKYDSVHGRAPFPVAAEKDGIMVKGKKINCLMERDPSKLPWKDMDVYLAVESTGLFTDREKAAMHLTAGAKKVLISAPAKNPDITIVMGVNHDKYDPEKHKIISNASCTTNGLAPAVKVVHDKYKIVRGFMTTIHAYTNDQKILDLPHSDLRRARAAALNIIPTTTGAAKAISLVIPDLKGKMDGYALRVPIPTVSVIDLTVELETSTTTEELRQSFRDAATGPLKGILQAVDEPLVSIDYKGDPHSSSVDLPFTMVLGKEKNNFAKIVAWYDNEWGYSVRTADLAALLAKSL